MRFIVNNSKAKQTGILSSVMKISIILFALSGTAQADEKKGFWASLVPDNSSALDFVDTGKSFFGQLFEDSKNTGKSLFNSGKTMIENTGETIKSLAGDE